VKKGQIKSIRACIVPFVIQLNLENKKKYQSFKRLLLSLLCAYFVGMKNICKIGPNAEILHLNIPRSSGGNQSSVQQRRADAWRIIRFLLSTSIPPVQLLSLTQPWKKRFDQFLMLTSQKQSWVWNLCEESLIKFWHPPPNQDYQPHTKNTPPPNKDNQHGAASFAKSDSTSRPHGIFRVYYVGCQLS